MMNEYNDRNQKQRLTYDADKVEFAAVISSSAVVDQGTYSERIAGSLDDYEADDKTVHSNWQGNDRALDDFVGGIHEEIKRRCDCMGDAYPFEFKENTLNYRGEKQGFYEFLLLISNASNLTAGENKCLPRLFERSTAKIIATYFGEYAQSFHTGSPRESGESFQDAMKHISQQTGEFCWGPEGGYDPAKVKDEGLDFVIWLKHADKRQLGQLFILGQCACGNNWNSKWDELQIKKLEKWFHPMTVIPPVRAFATPHHVSDVVLKEASRAAGLFFDRARLTMILHSAGNGIFDENTQNKMQKIISRCFK